MSFGPFILPGTSVRLRQFSAAKPWLVYLEQAETVRKTDERTHGDGNRLPPSIGR